jgi:RHS repeat-associated protein
VYEENELQFIQTTEGRLVPDGNGGYDYEYALKDHLGNTRVMFSQTGEVLQDQSYYPFGMIMGEALTFDMPSSLPDNKYLYNGKELQDDFDLGWYDYGARFYDPQLGRWYVVDPKSDKYTSISPYNYALNNPTLFIDPDGKDVYIYYMGPKKSNMFYWVDGHTAIGVQPKGIDKIYYHPTSGNFAVVENPGKLNDYGGSYTINESKTIDQYLNSGYIVFRARIKLPDKVEAALAELYVSAGAMGKGASDGMWCTTKVYYMLVNAYMAAGYSEEEAKKEAKKIIWYNFPELPSGGELIDAGFDGFDLFFQNDSDEKIQINVAIEDNDETNDDENSKKSDGLNSLISNFSNLEEGTYKWNGKKWIKQ